MRLTPLDGFMKSSDLHIVGMWDFAIGRRGCDEAMERIEKGGL